MEAGHVAFDSLTSTSALATCFSLAIVYVGSLYIWTSNLPRDHPQTIKERIVRVTLTCALSILVLYIVSDKDVQHGRGATLWRWMGIHSEAIAASAILPLVLFMILFLGPLYMDILEGGLSELHPSNLRRRFYDLRCWRNYFVAPFSEELVFRGCMLPILLPVFGPSTSIILAPSFFGVAHIHHAWERYYKENFPAKNVAITTLFQAFYTTLFGTLSSWLFLRTGHLASAVICHSFCNMMGFPDFSYALSHEKKKTIWAVFVAGLLLFLLLAKPLTSPSIYGNFIYGWAL